jgi:hypothetical protein
MQSAVLLGYRNRPVVWALPTHRIPDWQIRHKQTSTPSVGLEPMNPVFNMVKTVPSLRRMASSGMSRRVALVTADVSEELSASFIRVTRIGELGTMLAVTSNRR